MAPHSASDSLDDLLSRVQESLDSGLLPVDVFNDPVVHERELDRIFTRAWVFVGHDSEVPSPGDYVQRYIGNDAFVLVRGEDDEIRLLFDSCRHRGAQICRAEKGNASHFRCSYHGWTYKNSGQLAGAPLFRRAYGKGLDRSQWGLLSAPNLTNRHGFVFASLDPDAPSFEDWMGDMLWYFDLLFGHAKDGWEVIGDPQRWVMDANWKIGAENFTSDDYHTYFLHKSIEQLDLLDFVAEVEGTEYFHIQAGNGHALSHRLAPPGHEAPTFWYWPDDMFVPRFGPEMFDVARRTIANVGTIFPNFSFITMPLQATRETGSVPLFGIRVWQPRTNDTVEIVNWVIAPKGLPPEVRELTRRTLIGTFGSSGIYDQDDSEPWGSITQTAGTRFARKVGMKLNYQMGMPGVGTSRRAAPDAHPGPGVKYIPALEEGQMRGYWRRWAQFMRPGKFPSAMSPEEQNGHIPLEKE